MDQEQGNESTFTGWAILELMGHVRVAGKISQVAQYGSPMGRIDIPSGDGFVTQFFGGSSVYRITPCTEEIARGVAKHNKPEPVHSFELPRLPAHEGEGDAEESDMQRAHDVLRLALERIRDDDGASGIGSFERQREVAREALEHAATILVENDDGPF